jgi:hypothetical protein
MTKRMNRKKTGKIVCKEWKIANRSLQLSTKRGDPGHLKRR